MEAALPWTIAIKGNRNGGFPFHRIKLHFFSSYSYHGIPCHHLGAEDLDTALGEYTIVYKIGHDINRRKVKVPGVIYSSALICGRCDDACTPRPAPWHPSQGFIALGEVAWRVVLKLGWPNAREIDDGHHQGLDFVEHLDRLHELNGQPGADKMSAKMRQP